jgi:hypothetical protein
VRPRATKLPCVFARELRSVVVPRKKGDAIAEFELTCSADEYGRDGLGFWP